MIEEGLKFEQKGYNYVTFTKPTPQSHAPPAAQPAAAAPVSDASAQQEKPYIAPLNLPNSRGLKAGAAGASENAHVYASQSAPFATDDQTHASAKRQYTKIVPSQAHYELHPELVAEVKNRAYKPKLLDLNQPSKDKPAYSLPRRFNDPSKSMYGRFRFHL